MPVCLSSTASLFYSYSLVEITKQCHFVFRLGTINIIFLSIGNFVSLLIFPSLERFMQARNICASFLHSYEGLR